MIYSLFQINIRQKSTMIHVTFSFKQLLTTVTNSKENTVKFMQDYGILQSSMKCPGPLINGRHQGGCSQEMHLKITNDSKDKLQWCCHKVHTVHKDQCTFKMKDVKLSIRYNSWLLDSKLPLETILEFIYLWSQGFTHSEVMHELKLSKKTVTEWFMYFRESCIYAVMDASEQIGGNRIEVKINESKYHRGHRVEGQWVFGGREKYNKHKVFMIPVHNCKATTLLPLIKKWICAGSIIHSDCWSTYNGLTKDGLHTHYC